MRLRKEDILNIDKYLKEKGIKYLDVRYELIDHLVTEYENTDNYPDLGSYLKEKMTWCKTVSKAKEKTINRRYQKSIIQRIGKFFKSPIFYFVVIVIAFVFYALYLNVSEKVFLKSVFFSFLAIIVFQFGYFTFIHFRPRIRFKLLSKQQLFNMFSLPHLFLYFFNIISDFLKDSPVILVGYVFIGGLFNIAALVEVDCKQKEIIKEYEFLKKYFA